MEFHIEEGFITILTTMVLYICVCLVFAAFKVYQTFSKVGFDGPGNYITWGFILMAAGFLFVGAAGIFIYDVSVENRIKISMIGRAIQGLASLLLAMGFIRYYELATGQIRPGRPRQARRIGDKKSERGKTNG